MAAIILEAHEIDRFLADCGDSKRRFFIGDELIQEAYRIAARDHRGAVARGLYWMYQAAVNVPADASGLDPDQRIALIKERKLALDLWLKLPLPADETSHDADTTNDPKPRPMPLLFGVVPGRLGVPR